jgi:16S rRNA (guanine966-N2)-methyltransferase
MRISGGIAKGRRTATKSLLKKKPAGERLRPTSSKVREALFDILRDRVAGRSFVDLYAGTGTVGLEALSRGADRAVFVEPGELKVKTMRRCVDDFGFQDRALIIRGKAKEFIERASDAGERFDIFFVDPPYASEEIEEVLPAIEEGEVLKRDGVVIVEHFFKKEVPEAVGRLKVKRSYRYGDTVLTFYDMADL